MSAEPLYRSPGGVALYTQDDVDHLLRFYPWQPFELVEVGDALQVGAAETMDVEEQAQHRPQMGTRETHVQEAQEVDG